MHGLTPRLMHSSDMNSAGFRSTLPDDAGLLRSASALACVVAIGPCKRLPSFTPESLSEPCRECGNLARAGANSSSAFAEALCILLQTFLSHSTSGLMAGLCHADNVGDNVGDIAGMGADLFGSFAEATCAALVISSVSTIGEYHSYVGMSFPLLISASGILVCLLTTFIATDLRPARMVSEIENTLKYQLIISTLISTPVRSRSPHTPHGSVHPYTLHWHAPRELSLLPSRPYMADGPGIQPLH